MHDDKEQTGAKHPTVLIADHHSLFMNGVEALLRDEYRIVGAVRNGRELVTSALQLRPDLIILEVSLPHLNGIDAARKIRKTLPSTKLIFLTMLAEPIYVRKALAAGASAFVLKDGTLGELSEAVRAVIRGETWLSPQLPSGTMGDSHTPNNEQEQLTDRQCEILQLIAEGQPSKEVAHILNLSVKTVNFHRARIMVRLGARSSAELVRIAVERGLILPAAPRNS